MWKDILRGATVVLTFWGNQPLSNCIQGPLKQERIHVWNCNNNRLGEIMGHRENQVLPLSHSSIVSNCILNTYAIPTGKCSFTLH